VCRLRLFVVRSKYSHQVLIVFATKTTFLHYNSFGPANETSC